MSQPNAETGARLQKALLYHKAGKFLEAERLYLAILATESNNPRVLTPLGTLKAQKGEFEEAIRLLSRSLAIDRRQPSALNSLGNALSRLERHHEAVTSYDKAIALEPGQATAYFNRGNSFAALGRYDEAVRSYDKSIAIQPDDAKAHKNRGAALAALKRYDDAIAGYDRAIARRDDFAEAHFGKGLVLERVGRLEEARIGYERAVAIKPHYAEAHNSRGNVLMKLGRYRDALASYDTAVAIRKDFAEAHNNRGDALRALNRNEEAVQSFDVALALKPVNPEAYRGRGHALRALARHSEALASYEKAIGLQPDCAETYNSRGVVLQALNRGAEALTSYDTAIILDPNYAEGFKNRGRALQDFGRNREAVESYERAIALKPEDAASHYNRSLVLMELERFREAMSGIDRAIELDPRLPNALGVRLTIKTQICDWSGLSEARNAVVDAVGRGLPASVPFPLLSVECTSDVRRRCAQIFLSDKQPATAMPARAYRARATVAAADRIRLAYLSADFRGHATSYLMAGVFEQHDRERFEVHAISFGPADDSEMRTRVVSAVEHFTDVRSKTDAEVAALLRARDIDIAVDLMGFTKGSRPSILVGRPAPIQVNYLGYPGTIGGDHLDYIVADRVVIPEEDRQSYAENVVYLPDTYQCNDSKRRIGDDPQSRADSGLPADAFVFCSFNNNYKITPEMFDLWMRLLKQIDGSVLWLLQSNADAAQNLRREAQARGVDRERLIFAPKTPNHKHLARHGLADLFLDTLPYGAHTTASDALWAGLPVLTCMGDSFAGRVAASLLDAVGLPEMVTHSLGEYEALGLALARDRAALAKIKAKLQQNRETHALFNTARFTRHLEAAYVRMWDLHCSGRSPRPFAVDAIEGLDR